MNPSTSQVVTIRGTKSGELGSGSGAVNYVGMGWVTEYIQAMFLPDFWGINIQ
jgi:hypothetical protein